MCDVLDTVEKRGEERGRAEGRAETMSKIVTRLYSQGYMVNEIVRMTDETEEMVKGILHLLRLLKRDRV